MLLLHIFHKKYVDFLSFHIFYEVFRTICANSLYNYSHFGSIVSEVFFNLTSPWQQQNERLQRRL